MTIDIFVLKGDLNGKIVVVRFFFCRVYNYVKNCIITGLAPKVHVILIIVRKPLCPFGVESIYKTPLSRTGTCNIRIVYILYAGRAVYA